MNETHCYCYQLQQMEPSANGESRWGCVISTVSADDYEIHYFTLKIFQGYDACWEAHKFGKAFCQKMNK